MKKFLCVMLMALCLPGFAYAMGSEITPEANQVDANFVAGKDAIKIDGWQAAVDAFSKALKADPENADIHNYLGYAYRHLGQMENSFSHYDSALRINPNHRGAHAYLGQAYLQVGKPGKADEQLASLEKICGKSCEEYQDLARGIAAYRK